MINKKQKPTGILLAGGKSSRMQNALPAGIEAKCLLPLGSKPLLVHVLDRIRFQAEPLIINANIHQDLFLTYGLPVVPDTIREFSGPLAGILAGMEWANTHVHNCRYVLSISTDVPFLPYDLVERLEATLQKSEESIVLARSNNVIHPVIGLWPLSLKNTLENDLRSGLRKVLEWTNKQRTFYVDFPFIDKRGAKVDPFFNINTPSDLEKGKQLAELFVSDPEK